MASLAEHSPELLKEWDYSKNLEIKPEDVGKSSKRKVWWICTLDKRHQWEAAIGDRVLGTGCPVCKNLLILEGVNDLGTSHPELAAQIDKDSALFVAGKFYSPGSDKKLGWRCSFGHTWEATVRNRVGGQGCPFCSGKRLIPGENDFATRYPHLTSEIAWDKNQGFSPTSVFPSNPKTIWWVCTEGHEWQASINSRAISGSGCPYCRAENWTRKNRGTKAVYVPGRDDLASRYPSIASEWNFELNAPLRPEDVRSGDRVLQIWWNCDKGHAYQNPVRNRVFGFGCTYCAGKAVLPGFNDFASRNPGLVEEFDIERNGGLLPTEITAKSLKKVWWKCSLGHSWEISPSVRTKGNGCPVCSNYQIVQGFNDLESQNPTIALEWDSKLNGKVKASEVYFDSTKKFFWTCPLGHSYRQSPYARGQGVGCSVCGNRELLKGVNDIATRYPFLVQEWDSERNVGKQLDEIVGLTVQAFHWICSEGHSWKASLANRARGAGCPSCANYGYDPNKSSYFYFIQNQPLQAFKVGIANLGTNRLKVWKRLDWETLFYIEGTGRQILKLETMLLRWVRHELKLSQYLSQDEMRGHKGATETFSMELVSAMQVLEMIENSKVEAFEDSSRLKRRRN